MKQGVLLFAPDTHTNIKNPLIHLHFFFSSLHLRMAPTTSRTVTRLQWVSSTTTGQSNFCTHAHCMCQGQGSSPQHSCHTLKVSNSQPVTAPSASHPTFGVASGGQDGARRAEEVREITGKTFHLLLRCLPTGEERCVAGSTSALPPRQQAREEPGGCGRGKRLSVRGAGGYDSITFRRQTAQPGRQQAPVKLRAARGVNSALCQRTFASVSVVHSVSVVVGVRAGQGVVSVLSDGRSTYVWSAGVNTPTPSCFPLSLSE